MAVHTNDFANAMKTAMDKATGSKKKDSKTQHYHGTDVGEHVDYAAVKKLMVAAVKKLPKEDIPDGYEDFTMTVVVHGNGEGSAWIMDVNPYKTWAWRKR